MKTFNLLTLYFLPPCLQQTKPYLKKKNGTVLALYINFNCVFLENKGNRIYKRTKKNDSVSQTLQNSYFYSAGSLKIFLKIGNVTTECCHFVNNQYFWFFTCSNLIFMFQINRKTGTVTTFTKKYVTHVILIVFTWKKITSVLETPINMCAKSELERFDGSSGKNSGRLVPRRPRK